MLKHMHITQQTKKTKQRTCGGEQRKMRLTANTARQLQLKSVKLQSPQKATKKCTFLADFFSIINVFIVTDESIEKYFIYYKSRNFGATVDRRKRR